MQKGSASCWKTSRVAHGRGRTGGQSFLFSFCVSCTGGRSYCAKSVADAQPRNGRRTGNGDVLACIEVSGSWLHCVLSDKILTTIQRFGESVFKKPALLVQKILLCAVMERSAEDLSAVLEDLLLIELSFRFMIAILGCAHFQRAFSLVTQC